MGNVGALMQKERDAFIKETSEMDPGSVKKQSLRNEILMISTEEEALAVFDEIVNKKRDLSIANYAYIFLGFNNRFREFNRKLVLEKYFDIVEQVYEHGEFYFKYFNYYMLPKTNRVEEVEYMINGYASK